MSTRTSIVANPDGSSRELAEGMYGVPLLWLPMMSSDELAKQMNVGFIRMSRDDAVQRLIKAIPFIVEQLPDVQEIGERGNELAEHVRKCDAKHIAIDIGEPIAMNPKNFPKALMAAVKAIEDQDSDAQFKVGRQTYAVRDALCIVSTLDPENGVVEPDQMIGLLW